MTFGEATRKLTTAQGETPESVTRLSAGVLALAMPGVAAAREAHLERIRRGFTEEQAALAAELARTTPYSHQQWCEVLTIIGPRPDAGELARAIGERAIA